MSERAETRRVYREVKNPEDVRALCLNDLYYLMVEIMGRADMDNDWCFARCREVEAAPDGYLDLWAREHYKSTIITVGKTIQDILADPEITVGIFSHTRPIARSFLRQIKREFENNRLLQELFPHVCPPGRGEGRTWSEESGLIVRRVGNPKEATVEAWGLVDGQPTGKHFSLLVYDDVVTRESVTTPEMIRKVTQAWELSLNLGTHGAGSSAAAGAACAGRRRMIGTRYHYNDTYKTIMERQAAKPRLYPATRDGSMDGEPVFLSREILAGKRRDMGPYVFGCQMLQNPKADAAQGFKVEWFRTRNREGGEGARAPGGNWQAMNRYILADPACEKKTDSDYSVFWVVGLGPDQNYHVLDGVRDRLNLAERTRALFRLHRRYLPLAVGYEKYGLQADIEHMQDVMNRENYYFGIVRLGGQTPKNDRIRRLIPLFESGRVLFPYRLPYQDCEGRMHDLTREFLDEEFLNFPVCAHDDMLDCLARIVEPALGASFPMPPGFGGATGPGGAVLDYDVAGFGLPGAAR